MNTNKNAYHSTFEDCLYLIQDGFRESVDHPIYAKAHAADEKTQKLCAGIMTFSASEYQAVKYLQYYLEGRAVEPGFRSKKLDSLVKL